MKACYYCGKKAQRETCTACGGRQPASVTEYDASQVEVRVGGQTLTLPLAESTRASVAERQAKLARSYVDRERFTPTDAAWERAYGTLPATIQEIFVSGKVVV